MTRYYNYNGEPEPFASISEIIVYERDRLSGHDMEAHPLGWWGPIDLAVDQHIDQADPLLKQIKGRIYRTEALAKFENIYHQSPVLSDRIILTSEHPYVGINDGDRCLEHADLNPRIGLHEIAGIYDRNCGGCGAMVWLMRQFQIFMWPCCPENQWPEDSQLAPRSMVMRLHAYAKVNLRLGLCHDPDQTEITFDEITPQSESKWPPSRRLDAPQSAENPVEDEQPDEQKFNDSDGA